VVQAVRRNDRGGWDLVEPTGHGLSADIGLASDVADVLATLTAERWAAPRDDGSYGLAKPRITIEPELDSSGDAPHPESGGDTPRPDADASPDGGAPNTLRVEIGAPVASGGAFARRSGDEAVFVAPRTLETVAGRLPLNRTSLRFDGSSIETVTLE